MTKDEAIAYGRTVMQEQGLPETFRFRGVEYTYGAEMVDTHSVSPRRVVVIYTEHQARAANRPRIGVWYEDTQEVREPVHPLYYGPV